MNLSQYLYVIIAMLNARQHLPALLRRLADLPFPVRVVAIDQGSTDGTREWLRGLVSDGLMVVPNEGNVGVARAWNQGIRIALANRAEAVLICGHDTCPMPGAIERLVALAQSGVPFITGTQVPYDTPETPCAPPQPGEPLIAAPDFSCFLLPTPTIEALAIHEARSGAKISPWQLGLFDERFDPAYFEDGDYHIRLHQAGIGAFADPGALFRHDCSLTIRTNPEIARLNQETFRRNADLYAQKWGGLPHQLDVPPQARPLNVSDEQWAAMTGGRPVLQVDPAVVAANAQRVYAQYGITG